MYSEVQEIKVGRKLTSQNWLYNFAYRVWGAGKEVFANIYAVSVAY